MASTDILAPGSVFAGQFRILELLAEGEMGAAYVVEVPARGTRCVLKAMSATLVKQAALRKLFAGYAKSSTKVASTSILQTLDAGIDRATGRPWFTTDLVRGQDLATRVARFGALPVLDARALLAALGEVLGKTHARGLVHYDLTPENIHLVNDRPLAIKLRELTISRLVSDALAADGELIGTAEWMSPEQFDLGRPLTAAANVWSFALLAFYALTGCPYWKSAWDVPSPSKDLLREILGGPIVPASERARELGCAALPPWFDPWFARCVIREPDNRPPNADAAWSILAESLKKHSDALANEVDDQATTMRLPDRPGRAKGSRSLPRGILVEAKSGSAQTGPAAPSVVRTTEHKRRPRVWPYLVVAFAVSAVLVWLRLSPEERQVPMFETKNTAAAGSDRMATSRPSRAVPLASSEAVDAGGVSYAATSIIARPDAGARDPLAAVRTFASDDDAAGTADYDLGAALKALNGVYYGECSVPAPGKLVITFAPSGRVKKVAVLKGDYDEATTTCISARFAAAKMAPFRGGEQSLTADVVATR